MTERLEARVAEILNTREVVLNKGASDDVQVGMRFAILNSKGANVRDPESGEVLGSVEIVKTIVKVVRVADRLAIARTFRTHVEGGGLALPEISRLLGPSRSIVETLKTNESTYEQELDESESFVKRGDIAIQVVGDEYYDKE